METAKNTYWEKIFHQNEFLLGETWARTHEWMEEEGYDISKAQFPDSVRNFVELHSGNGESDIYLQVQAATMDIAGLLKEMFMADALDLMNWEPHQIDGIARYGVLVWHILHLEP